MLSAPTAGAERNRPSPPRTGAENIAGIDRQQRGDAAQQHGKQVERDGAEQNRIVADIGKAGEQCRDADRLSLFGAVLALNEADEDASGDENRRAQPVDHRRPEHIEKAAERRAADDRGLLRGCGSGDGARQKRARHDPRYDRMQGRRLEGARGSGDQDQRQDRRAIEPALQGAEREQGGTNRLDHLAGARNGAAVEMIGGLADRQRQHDDGKELHQADQAEVERIVGEVVELPADRDRLHLVGAAGRGAGAPEQHERAMAQQ
jgi:hypothetical protein